MEDTIIQHWMTLETLAHKKVSYAQNFEDILLERALPAREGFFIDAGANDPVFHSVTKRFSEKGWRGVHIEPNPTLCDRLRADRPRDVIINAGVSDAPGALTFFEVPEKHGWSTFVPQSAKVYRGLGESIIEKRIPVTTLAAVCEQHADRAIDFLKIDVEGFERQAIAGADWRRWRPRVVVIEATWPDLWEHLLQEQDYLLAAFDGLNRFYVRTEDRDLIPMLAVPVNVLDDAVPYDYLHLIEQFDSAIAAQLNLCRALGPTTLRLAHRLQALAHHHPRLASLARRLLQRTVRASDLQQSLARS